MTTNLKYALIANSTGIGVDHSTNGTFEFNTGDDCGTNNSACIMNGNTAMTERQDGYYYSWYAATAGTGTVDMASGDATGSICPKGWRLPANYASDTTKSYGSITQAYLGFSNYASGNYIATLEISPLDFHRAGYYFTGTFHAGGGYGHYWSSTAKSTDNGHDLYYSTSATSPQGVHYKSYGFSVRCVSK